MIAMMFWLFMPLTQHKDRNKSFDMYVFIKWHILNNILHIVQKYIFWKLVISLFIQKCLYSGKYFVILTQLPTYNRTLYFICCIYFKWYTIFVYIARFLKIAITVLSATYTFFQNFANWQYKFNSLQKMRFDIFYGFQTADSNKLKILLHSLLSMHAMVGNFPLNSQTHWQSMHSSIP